MIQGGYLAANDDEIMSHKRTLANLILKLLKGVKDPELNVDLVESGLIQPELINIDEENKKIEIFWIPTTPFCPLILYISAVIRHKVKEKFINWKVSVKLHPDVLGSEMWNERLNDEKTLDNIFNEIKEKGWLQYFYTGEEK